jgi:5'-nucleotidase (lipoprotein e(P4) family)
MRSFFAGVAVVVSLMGNSLCFAQTAPPGPKAKSPAATIPAINPQESVLLANLYMQTSGEYEAICLQTYSLALERLKTKLAAQAMGDRKPAVVMDLDETVIDNSGFQSFLDREKLNYSDALWDSWEKDYPDEVRLIPGAKGFIAGAENLGVTVVYLSNRLTKNSAGTATALTRLGLNTEGLSDRLLLKEPGTSSDKTARRKTANEKFSVLMYFGDNLRDFSEEFAAPKLGETDDAGQLKAIAERRAKVDRAAYRWGNDWVILPNPVYGEWQRLLGKDPRTKLNKTRMVVPAAK